MATKAASLLIRAGIVAEEQVTLARQSLGKTGGTIGEQLVLSGFVDDEDLTSFYHDTLMVPYPRYGASELCQTPTP